MKSVLVTGSAGLVGSACVRHFAARGWKTSGVDNDARAEFFGPAASTGPNLTRLCRDVPGYRHHAADVRYVAPVFAAVREARPTLIVHAAAQPSHDYAADHAHADFGVNAVGTLNLLEAARRHAPEAAFVFLSTNKVYGDAPNGRRYAELPWRYDCAALGEDWRGFDETLSVDQCAHSLFGCSKLAADVLVQEYGRAFGMPTACFRAGCLTGGDHAGAEQHGFLAYLARCCKGGKRYTVYGYKGKQVRDQLHAADVASACEAFANVPRAGAVYNLGGGRENSVSVLEAIDVVERAAGKRLDWAYADRPRRGDHVVWISDTRKFRKDYPEWEVTRSLADIVAELCGGG
jgi:CDP-paratose 2-epimerase